jgi:hypothetical protein
VLAERQGAAQGHTVARPQGRDPPPASRSTPGQRRRPPPAGR